MPFALKRLASSVAPDLVTLISASRGRRHSHHLVKEWGLFDLNRRLIDEIGNRVVSGPFKGLVLTRAAQNEHIGPYLLGTYEMELHPWWERLLQTRFDQIVDIGANFGYYAVGLAQRFPRAATVAFDADWWARRATREMARANGVSTLTVKGLCSAGWLEAHLGSSALIVSDCEGYERQLFCTSPVPALAGATLVIELHEAMAPGVTAEISARFAATHAFETLESRSDTHVPIHSAVLTDEEVGRASLEVRGKQMWMLLTPKGVRGA